MQTQSDLSLRDANSWQIRRTIVFAALIVILAAIAYAPAYSAGFIWDDDSYVTENALLHDLNGLIQIWIPKQTLQYYPIVFSSFWIEYHVWGLNPLGYHLTNIVLHILNALLIWRICSVLRIPAAWLIAAVFALHPVHVESVAWITERKNVMSGMFYLLSILAFLRFDSMSCHDERFKPSRDSWGWYGASLILLVLALLSKTVTCSLPAVLILIMLYQRRRVTLARIALLVPMFIIGVILALHTASLEHDVVGARGSDFAFSFIDRCLIASKALLFYPLKLVCPWPLMFNYPRWEIDSASILSYWSIAAVLVIGIASLWIFIRGRRGPVLALAFYAGTIFPALGFFNVYPMRFSFVADHFQYLASLGIVTFIVGGLFWLARSKKVMIVAGVVLLPTLCILTFQHAQTFHNEETVWRDTLSKNPNAWMPHSNLASLLLNQRRDPKEAEYHLRETLRIKPDHYPARMKLANALYRQRRFEEARVEIDAAIDAVLAQLADRSAPKPKFMYDDYVLRGTILEELGLNEEAEEAFREAIRIVPDNVSARELLGRLLFRQRRLDDAAQQFEAIGERGPEPWITLRSLGIIHEQQERCVDSIKTFDRALDIAPEVSIQLLIVPHLIRVLTSCPDEQARDLARATRVAEQLCAVSNYREPASLHILATVYHQTGRHDEAMQVAQRALEIARANNITEVVQQIETWINSVKQPESSQ